MKYQKHNRILSISFRCLLCIAAVFSALITKAKISLQSAFAKQLQQEGYFDLVEQERQEGIERQNNKRRKTKANNSFKNNAKEAFNIIFYGEPPFKSKNRIKARKSPVRDALSISTKPLSPSPLKNALSNSCTKPMGASKARGVLSISTRPLPQSQIRKILSTSTKPIGTSKAKDTLSKSTEPLE